MLLYGLGADAEISSLASSNAGLKREPEFMIGLIIFLLSALLAFCWWRLVKAREQARSAAGSACRQHGLVLVDDTVILDSLDTSRWRKKRLIGLRYRFDFAVNGVLNHGGRVLISPRQPALVIVNTPQGQLIEVI